ncbi:hypothetical protein Hanom_Chr00s000001g01598291 [Helianthus anomalus]
MIFPFWKFSTGTKYHLLISDHRFHTNNIITDETMVNRVGLTHWSRQEGLIPFSRRSLAGSPVG